MLHRIMRICLAGIMGSGKSHFGPGLASALGLEFVDLDAAIGKEEGRSIASIFALEGEKYFREVESDLLEKTLRQDNLVLSLGGGTPCFNGNLEKIKACSIMIWLNLAPSVLARRLFHNRHSRPLIAHCRNLQEIEETISRLLEQRKSVYGAADLIITDPNADAKAVALQVKALWPPPSSNQIISGKYDE